MRPSAVFRAMFLGAALVSAPVRAEIKVEIFAADGRLIGTEIFYRPHAALVLGTPSGAAIAERRALVAWLDTAGADVAYRDTALQPETAADLQDEAFDWLRRTGARRDAGLVVVLDGTVVNLGSRTAPELALELGGDAHLPLRAFVEALDRAQAVHALLVFTRPLPVGSPDWLDAAPAPPVAWLTRDASRAARQALVPQSERIAPVPLLVSALSADPERFYDADRVHDPDSALTARDVAALSANLTLRSFGRGDRGGEVVLARRVLALPGFGREAPHEAYVRARYDDRGRLLDAFLERFGDDGPWGRAVSRQIALRREAETILAGRSCDAGLAFLPQEILTLNAGVVGRLAPIRDTGDLARQLLAATRLAAGLGPDRLSAVVAECARADTDPRRRPERALRLALVSEDPAGAIALAAEGLSAPQNTVAAAILGGLALLSEDTRRTEADPVLETLRRTAVDGHPGARLVLALHHLDGRHLAEDRARAMALLADAAEAGAPIADALYAAAMLSREAPFRDWRAGLAEARRTAVASYLRARTAGVEIDDRIVEPRMVDEEMLLACTAALDGFVPDTAVAIDRIGSLADFARIFADPRAALETALGETDPAAVRSACAELPDPSRLPVRLAAVRDGLELKLAALALIEGDLRAAETRLAALSEENGTAALLSALLADRAGPAARRSALARAAELGVETAAVALALQDLESAAGADREAGRVRLRRLAARGLPLAETLLAADLVDRAPSMDRRGDRNGADKALFEALLLFVSARNLGFGGDQSQGIDWRTAAEVIAARMPRAFGVTLVDLTAEHREVLPGLPASASGALVLGTAPEGGAAGVLVPGDVILAIGAGQQREVAGADSASISLGRALLAAVVKGSGAIDLSIHAASTGRTEQRRLPVPNWAGEIPVPVGLR
ncbi:MAG: hypothetical protein ACFBSD_09445 [Paracoccaceae bacterium]